MSTLDYRLLYAAAALLVFPVSLYVRSWVEWKRRSGGRPLPPGPPPLPFVGNLFNAPRYKPWIGYRGLCTRYGDIVQLQFLDGPAVILGSPEVINEALDKRSANTSDRKQTLLLRLAGAANNPGFMPYGPKWRRHRRVVWQYFTPNAITRYHDIQYQVARRFLFKLLQDPSDFEEHIRYAFGGTMMKVVYDIDDEEDIFEHIKMVELAQEGLGQAFVHGKYLVEFLPVLRHMPSWLPGAYLKRMSKRWMDAVSYLQNVPVEKVKQAMSEGLDKSHSMVGELLSKLNKTELSEAELEEEEGMIKDAAEVSLQGNWIGHGQYVPVADRSGTPHLETDVQTYSTLRAAFLAISQHPEVLQKAHEELDLVVGPDRLPNFHDRDSLVYVNAIVKETLRWHPVAPLSLPHYTMEDDVLNGYFIPAGTVLIPNAWACLHDPDTYEDPETFRPERFIRDGELDPNVADPMQHAFGYGRRVCPGRHIADEGLFINIASALHVFDISPQLDDEGQPIKIVHEQTDGLLSYPEKFACVIKPRSARAEALVRSVNVVD